MYTSMKLAVKIFITCRLRANQYTVFFLQRNICYGVFKAHLICLFALLLQEYHNELLGMSCTCACICLHATLLDLHLWRFPLTYLCTLSHLVYNCISRHQCFVWCVFIASMFVYCVLVLQRISKPFVLLYIPHITMLSAA